MRSRRKPNDRPTELLDVIEDLPDLVATFDADGRLFHVNAAGRRLLSLPDGDHPGSLLLSDLYPEGGAELMLREALAVAASGGEWKGRGELLTRKGHKVPVMQHLVTHLPEEGKARAFTVVAHPSPSARVTTDRDAILAASLGFLHDLNNLLGPILAYASLAGDEVDPSSKTRRYLDQILIAAERARELSSRVLARMRPRPLDKRPVLLADLVTEVATWLRDEYPHCRVEVELPRAPATVLGDPVGLEQVVLNLGKNAIDSLPAEGGVVRIGLAASSETTLRLTVQDNGYGMDEEMAGRIFEPFFSTKAGGTGVGLSVTTEVVRQHGGTITVESTPGEGTVFRVEFPLRTDL
jgi:two-component system, cell cycle sensor histidine kinase and response regulator CckA